MRRQPVVSVIVLATVTSLALAAHSSRGEVPPHGHLAISLTDPADGDFGASFSLARSAGMTAVSLPIFWDDVEVEPGVFAPEPNFLAIANQFYPAKGVAVSLELNPIDTNQRRVPADLANLPFDHPTVLARFAAWLDWAFAQIPAVELTCLSIGNEVDGYLSSAEDWAAYEVFFEAAADRARALRPGVVVGVKATYSGLVDTAKSPLMSMNQPADGVFVTYYPLESDFTVKEPRVVSREVRRLVTLYAGRPLYVLEAGYPSGRLNESSERRQADFIREMFRAWDQNVDAIRLVEFTWLHDIDPATVSFYQQYYGVDDPAFLEYLATLGLRTHAGAGRDKEAFVALEKEAARRGF